MRLATRVLTLLVTLIAVSPTLNPTLAQEPSPSPADEPSNAPPSGDNATALPDLVAEVDGPIEFAGNEPAAITVRVTNVGGASPASRARLAVGPEGDVRNQVIGVPPLAPGELWAREIQIPLPLGFSAVHLWADADNDVAENNETNNEGASWAFRHATGPVASPNPVRLEAEPGQAADGVEVRIQEETHRVTLTFSSSRPQDTHALVDREWLDSRVGAAALESVSYSIEAREERSYYHFTIPTGDSQFLFRRFAPAVGVESYGHGSPENLVLEGRPMFVSILSAPHDEPTTGGEGLNATWYDPRLLLSLEDGDERGQNVWLSKTWLAAFGIARPAVSYQDGTPVRVDEVGNYWVVRAPHFSILDIRTDNFLNGPSPGYYKIDNTDDTAIKTVPMPALTGATDSYLWIWGRASSCSTSGNSMMLVIDGVDYYAFDPCARWGTSTPSWGSGFQIGLSYLHSNVQFSFRKTNGDYLNRNVLVYYDSSPSCTYTSASENGLSICHEISWSLQLYRNPTSWTEASPATGNDKSPYGRTLTVVGSPPTVTASNTRYGVGYQLDGSSQRLTGSGSGVSYRATGDAAWFFSWSRSSSSTEDVLIGQGEWGGGVNKASYAFHCIGGSSALRVEHSDSGGTVHPIDFASACPTGEHRLAIRRVAGTSTYEVNIDATGWATGTYTGDIATTGGSGICIGMRSGADECSGGLAGACACNFYEIRVWKNSLSRTALNDMTTTDTYKFATEGTEDAVYNFGSPGPSNNPPTLTYTGASGYTIDGVNPDSGASGTTFTYKVKYTDAEGQSPSYIRVHVDGSPTGSPMTWESGSITTGAVYYYSTSTLTTGTHSYHFETSDGTTPARLPSSGDLSGPTVSATNNPPSLAFAGTTGYTTDGVDPDTATSSTTFTFRVKYTDPDGTLPSYVRVIVDGTTRTMSQYSGSISTGAIYTYSTTLTRGSRTYYFEANDGTASARLPTSGSYSGPTVMNSPPYACSSPFANGLTVTATSCSTDVDNDPLSWTWYWGDGASTNGGSPASHTYACPGGSYTITLSVSDGQPGGTSSDADSLNIFDYDDDGDALKNCQETPSTYQTNPNVADTDGDGINDGAELSYWNSISGTAWNTNYDRFGSTTNNLLKFDADGDGIKDGYEFVIPSSIFEPSGGDCSNVGGRYECPNPIIRDVYVQLNWLVKPATDCFFGFCFTAGHSDAPTQTDIDTVRGNFETWNNAPGRANNDKIRLHLYVGRNGDGNGAVGTHVDVVNMNQVSGSWNDVYDYKNDATNGLPAARNGYFIFSLFVHNLQNGNQACCAGGAGEVFGNDHAVSKEAFRAFDPKETRAAWMQELGHNLLGLHHSLPCVNGGHDHGYWHNPSATHLNWVDAPPPATGVDEGNNANGYCGVTPPNDYRDGQQDVFSHASSGSDAMGFNYYPGNNGANSATSWITTGWLALRPYKAVPLARPTGTEDVLAHSHDDHDHGGLLPDEISDVIHDGIHGPPVAYMRPRPPV